MLAPRKEAATKGVEGAIDKKPAMVAALAPKRVVFTRCFPGRVRGLLDIVPASLRNATMDPVKVIPPSSKLDGRREERERIHL